MYITSSSSLKTCKEIIDSLVECKFFNVEDYVWLIGANHLNNIIEDYNNGPTYFPFTRKTDSTGKLFYIDYRLVPNNDTLKLVRKTDNLRPNFMVASRGYGKTNMQLKYLEELMKLLTIIHQSQTSSSTIQQLLCSGMMVRRRSWKLRTSHSIQRKVWLWRLLRNHSETKVTITTSLRNGYQRRKLNGKNQWKKYVQVVSISVLDQEDGDCDNAERNCNDCKYLEKKMTKLFLQDYQMERMCDYAELYIFKRRVI